MCSACLILLISEAACTCRRYAERWLHQWTQLCSQRPPIIIRHLSPSLQPLSEKTHSSEVEARLLTADSASVFVRGTFFVQADLRYVHASRRPGPYLQEVADSGCCAIFLVQLVGAIPPTLLVKVAKARMMIIPRGGTRTPE